MLSVLPLGWLDDDVSGRGGAGDRWAISILPLPRGRSRTDSAAVFSFATLLGHMGVILYELVLNESSYGKAGTLRDQLSVAGCTVLYSMPAFQPSTVQCILEEHCPFPVD